MKELSIEELKSLQVEMLCRIDEFCNKNNIKYSLAFGTLIGAIRHKGYIPWDDDIDIVMPRTDYNLFIKTFNGSYENLYLLAPELNRNFYAPYANVCDNRTLLLEGLNGHRGIEMGVKIDVFPVDGTPPNEIDYRNLVNYLIHIKYIMAIKRQVLSLFHPKSFVIVSFYKMVYAFTSYINCQQIIMNKIRLYPYEESEYVDTIVFPVYKYNRLLKSVFEEYIDVEFEGHMFKAIKEYDIYLKKIYGDYMKLPPVEKRIPHHGFTALWKE